jgi:hypothetical protein
MGAVGEELGQALFCLRDRIRPRDADGVEGMLACGRDEGRLEGGRIAQKSRLA